MPRMLKYVISITIISALIYHMVYTRYPFLSTTEHLNNHLTFGLVLVFLSALAKNTKQWTVLVPLLIMSLIVTGYVRTFYGDLENRYGNLTLTDLMMAIVLIVIVIEASRRAMGKTIPVVALIFLAYALFGFYLPPGPFHVAKIDPVDLVAMLTFQFGGTGIYGMLLEISAFFIFLFTVMGGVIQLTGAQTVFRNLGLMVGKKLRGGPGLMAVCGSALIGTITGVTDANVLIMGQFSIPLMKKVGFTPKEAAAIEMAASNGGQIMPPVMGAAAFVMSVMTGIKYVSIMLAAVIPALLYFLTLGIHVQLLAMKKNIMPMTALGEKVDVRQMVWGIPSFAIPLGIIVFLFVKGYSPMYVAFWGTIASFAVAILRPGKRATLSEWLESLTSGIMAGATIAVTVATVGIIVKVMTVTGLGVKLPSIVETFSMGNLSIALILVMISCLVLGMGVPTTPAYILVAMVAAPVLVKMGVGLLPAHFFVFYLAVMALITPPVAGAAIVASRIAGATYFETALEGSKMCIAGFLVPFIFVRNPIFLMMPGEGIVQAAAALLVGLIMVLTIDMALVGYYFVALNSPERLLFLLCSALAFLYLIVFLENYVLLFATLALFILLTLSQVRKWRLVRATTAIRATT